VATTRISYSLNPRLHHRIEKANALSVKVRLEGDTKDIHVLFSILTSQNASAESSVARTERMLALAKGLPELLDSNAAGDNVPTIIGNSEFMHGDRLEREYWMSLSPLTPLLRQKLLKPFSANEHTLDLCVMHVQYTSSPADSSNVHRASLRLTTSVAPKAYQDKCRVCEECEARRQCANCWQSADKFKKSKTCIMHRNCDRCPEFKWGNTSGVLFLPHDVLDGLSLDGLKRILEGVDRHVMPQI